MVPAIMSEILAAAFKLPCPGDYAPEQKTVNSSILD